LYFVARVKCRRKCKTLNVTFGFLIKMLMSFLFLKKRKIWTFQDVKVFSVKKAIFKSISTALCILQEYTNCAATPCVWDRCVLAAFAAWRDDIFRVCWARNSFQG